MRSKTLFLNFYLLLALASLAGCSTNPATGKQQFTALMSPQQEVQVSNEEHQNILREFGEYDNAKVQAYVRAVGARVTQSTERPDVQYKFFVIDSPIVNAFALPGGYIYVSRGLLALANDEAELAAVLSHETGHITARHSAERYSHGVLTSLGAGILSAAIDKAGVTQALGAGSSLYLSSYSRTQEAEADSLGLRYMTRGGYDASAMSDFLLSLQNETALESQSQGRGASQFSYFSTHPATAERVAATRAEAANYGGKGSSGREEYLTAVDGIIYGDSPAQGFVRGRSFLHPALGFGFDAPAGFRLVNQPSQVIAASDSGAVIVFDMAAGSSPDAFHFLTETWMKGEAKDAEKMSVNGMNAATASFPGNVNGQPVTIRLVAIQWTPNNFARFQFAIPKGATESLVESLKAASYSFRRLSDAERQSLRPYVLRVVTARPGDTAASLARQQPFDKLQEERFRVLNALAPGQPVVAGQKYKLVVSE